MDAVWRAGGAISDQQRATKPHQTSADPANALKKHPAPCVQTFVTHVSLKHFKQGNSS